MSSIKVDKKMDSLKRKSIEAMSNKYIYIHIILYYIADEYFIFINNNNMFIG